MLYILHSIWLISRGTGGRCTRTRWGVLRPRGNRKREDEEVVPIQVPEGMELVDERSIQDAGDGWSMPAARMYWGGDRSVDNVT